MEKYLPIIKVNWNNDPFITGPDGTKNYFWIAIGPIISIDNIKAYQFILWKLHISIGFIS